MDKEKQDDAQKLAEQLKAFVISPIKTDRILGEQTGVNIVDFPPEVLSNIFSFVGKNASNPPPPDYLEYLTSRSEEYFQKKIKRNSEEYFEKKKLEWIQKMKEEYAVRSLMSLRQVCSKFEYIINNEMVGGKDFDFVLIDVKIKGDKHDSKGVMVLKYGGNGSTRPATHFRRISKWNETEYEHIQKCEKIRNLYITDMILSESLFEKILSLDLSQTKKIVFERILDLNFDESINIVAYIQHFLNSLNSPANVFFNSQLFDPNIVLFGLEEEPMEQDVIEEIIGVEVSIDGKFHKKLRDTRPKINKKVKAFRGYRAINVLNNIVNSEQHIKESSKYHTRGYLKKYKKQIEKNMITKIGNREEELKEAGKWHLNRAFKQLKTNRGKTGKKDIMFNLRTIKKITSPTLSNHEEESIISGWKDSTEREELMKDFQFMDKFRMKSRYYTVDRAI